MLGCDGFLLALDAMMRRSGQGAHISQSVVELDALPDVEALGRAWWAFTKSHPILSARLKRNWRGLPVWRIPDAADPARTPLVHWREPGAPGKLAGAKEVESLEALCLEQRMQTRGGKPSPFRLRLDVLERPAGAAVVVTWWHLLVDGKGVELLLAELARMSCGAAATADTESNTTGPSEATAARGLAEEQPGSSVRQMIDRSRAFADHFLNLAKTRFFSLSGPRLRASKVHCRVVTLDSDLTAKINARAQELTNQLINTPFFLAASAVAHGKVFESRGLQAGPQVITLPLQTRPKGGRGPIFQNYVTILFFNLAAEELTDTPTATAAIQEQFIRMMRQRLDRSFSVMLDLMRWIPPRLYTLFLRKQMHGEITSSFHSYTGPFAIESSTFAGARIDNAWHIPVICTPPGTGLFLGEYDGRLSLSLTWRDGSVTDAEREALMRHFIEALLGEPMDAIGEDAATLRLDH